MSTSRSLMKKHRSASSSSAPSQIEEKAPAPVLQTSDFKKLPLLHFLSESHVASSTYQRRLTSFVLTPEIRGCEKELAALGMATVQLIQHQHRKSRLYKFPLVLAQAENDSPLSPFSKTLAGEKQLPIEFHIAAHGDPDSIGGILRDDRITIEEFAKSLFAHFKAAGFYDINDFKNKPFHFVFHTCNSAWSDINTSMDSGEIETAVKRESLIGKFGAALIAERFTNFTVAGFRGYYSHMSSKKGSYVSSHFYDGKTLVAEKTKFVINAAGEVALPSQPFFYVSAVKPTVAQEEKVQEKLSPF